MTPPLRVEHLRKVFPSPRATDAEGFIAVDDVSFALPPGGSLAVVGESGSGKTTVARMIAGLETPTFGLIGYDGTARATGRAHHRERRTRAREVQMVFQDPYTSLDPHQSVAAAIGEILRVHFPEESAHHGERVQQLLQQVGLDERQGAARPRALSGGQRQRAAIARALALRPAPAADPRRGGGRARRQRPGPDHQPARRPAAVGNRPMSGSSSASGTGAVPAPTPGIASSRATSDGPGREALSAGPGRSSIAAVIRCVSRSICAVMWSMLSSRVCQARRSQRLRFSQRRRPTTTDTASPHAGPADTSAPLNFQDHP